MDRSVFFGATSRFQTIAILVPKAFLCHACATRRATVPCAVLLSQWRPALRGATQPVPPCLA
eukprot:8432683-Pyramimonas_sp.AAC.1